MNTILLLILVVGFLAMIIYFALRSDRFFKRKNILFLVVTFFAIVGLFWQTGTHKFQSDIMRIFRNSRIKSSIEVYAVLFGEPIDTCVRIIKFKDQLIPKIDCCIWMEVNICAEEVKRISNLRNYTAQKLVNADSLTFLNNYPDKPEWWVPQKFNNNITVLHVRINERNSQSVIFNADSTLAFICDKAL